MRRPRTDDLPGPLARVARSIAGELRAHGHDAWIVGGAVRDLALGRPVSEVDLVTSARPDDVRAIFPRTTAVGAAFGIVVVREGEASVEVATFRAERGYSDARRPDEVRFADSPDVDALRRDFTCNALYLDPLDDRCVDPSGGLADLAAKRLATVGDPGERFREDGLRLLRMARFEAALDLAPAPGLHEAARGALGALRGVSPERVLAELTKILLGPRPAAALGALEACGIAEVVLPGFAALAPAERAARIAIVARFAEEAPAGEARLAGALAALLGSPNGASRREGAARGDGGARGEPREDWASGGSGGSEDGGGGERGGEGGDDAELAAHLERLRPSRALSTAVRETQRLRAEMAALAAEGARASRRLRAMRAPSFDAALALARATRAARGEDAADLARLAAWCAAAPDAAPAPLVRSEDLLARGVAAGPRLGAWLREAENAQLDGEFEDAAGAARWLDERLGGGA